MRKRRKLRRYTAADIAQLVGCHPNTIRRLADLNLIDSRRDFNGWRIFNDAELCAKEVRRLMLGGSGDTHQKQESSQEPEIIR